MGGRFYFYYTLSIQFWQAEFSRAENHLCDLQVVVDRFSLRPVLPIAVSQTLVYLDSNP